MYLDNYGLPMQSNGDVQDQLQRVGMIAVGQQLQPDYPQLVPQNLLILAMRFGLRKEKLYTRFVGGPTNTVTGDQLVPAMAYWTLVSNRVQVIEMPWVFAQNTVNVFNGSKTFPDYILLRVLPFIARLHWLMYPLTCLIDILLVLAAIMRINQGSTEDTDDNNTAITLIVCRAKMPTPMSILAAKLYGKYRKPPGVQGALDDYHAAKTGGNPEIAALYSELVSKYLS